MYTSKNASVLPLLLYRTNARITSFDIKEEDISLMIKNLDLAKVHGCHNISIKMIKIFSESLTVPLKIMFEQSLKGGRFPEIWRKANVVPVHKNEDKNFLKNYRPISLFPIFSKVLERVIYNSLFNHFHIFSQSGFLPGDSYIAQLLSIIHEIQTAFDKNPTAEVRGILLNISKAFDKVWNSSLLFKLQAYGVEGQLLSLLKDYLHNRKQRVVLSGQTSDWRKINSGVPKRSVLGPLLFLMLINDLPVEITSICKISADDTSLFSKVYDIDISAKELNSDFEKVSK